jgi:peroxiredoxin
MNSIRFLLAGLSALLVLHGADDFQPGPAPAWRLVNVDGKAVGSEQFNGKVVVLDFWATWCAPCRAEIPGYIDLQEKYEKAGVVIVGVSLDDAGAGAVRKIIAIRQLNYRIVMGDEKVVEAFGGVEAIPTTFIIDRRGIIRYRKVGSLSAGEFEAVLKRFLK